MNVGEPSAESVKRAREIAADFFLKARMSYSLGQFQVLADMVASGLDTIREEERERMLTPLQLIEVDLTAGDMPAKTRVALALSRVRAIIKDIRSGA
jgi:hypothetical protein